MARLAPAKLKAWSIRGKKTIKITYLLGNKMFEYILELLRKNETIKMLTFTTYKIVRKMFRIAPHLPIDAYGHDANKLIKKYLESDRPCMICRFGENELRTAIAYLNMQNGIKTNIRSILRMESFNLNEPRVVNWMRDVAGFFPSNIKTLTEFSKLYLNDMKEADILGCWLAKETKVVDHLSNKLKTVQLASLDPWNYETPWTIALQNKKILVIHPFTETIKKQYKNRDLIFKNNNILPKFELLTLQAVQSAGGNKTEFKTWFDALNYMCSEIDKINFDIALIGAGAYGFSLAAHIKRIGKKSVHLGGVSQLLFGIKGNRWDETELAKKLYNEYWVRPLTKETPQSAKKVEGGSYW